MGFENKNYSTSDELEYKVTEQESGGEDMAKKTARLQNRYDRKLQKIKKLEAKQTDLIDIELEELLEGEGDIENKIINRVNRIENRIDRNEGRAERIGSRLIDTKLDELEGI